MKDYVYEMLWRKMWQLAEMKYCCNHADFTTCLLYLIWSHLSWLSKIIYFFSEINWKKIMKFVFLILTLRMFQIKLGTFQCVCFPFPLYLAIMLDLQRNTEGSSTSRLSWMVVLGKWSMLWQSFNAKSEIFLYILWDN